ncbi:hypothetical protein PHJA_002963700 [Phtheirospermum japonicum]|uniref:Uncharacterized protein n=1 Tax=Phtheirospermum japonicum TaxID=374723 RepID=A0A830D8V0_9LAMI|nr:hypothetical protein PHJA_002963700 [Phtheirospermum japonicum]
MEPLAASLWSSFRRVPPAAIPPMMDCILSSTAVSPSSLFSDLLKGFPNLTKNSENMECEWRNCVAAYVAAPFSLTKEVCANHIHMFVWKIWIPLLKIVHTNDRELFNKVTSLFLDVVTETDSWEVLEATMVPLLLRSIALTLDAALQHKHEGVVSGSTLSNGCSAKVFAGNILWDFSNLTLQMLSQSLEHRSSAVRFLLPLIFKAFAQESSYKVAVPGFPLY